MGKRRFRMRYKEEDEIATKGEIVIYQAKDKQVQLEVKLTGETIWLTQMQISRLFGTQRPAITKHLYNIFKSGELQENSVCSILEHTTKDGKEYATKFYNLDAIISVGYRINSKRATQFRVWATNLLKKHLVDGYTVNEHRLKQQETKLLALQRAIKLIASTKDRKQLGYREAIGLIEVISDYNYALDLLDDYDYKRLKISRISREARLALTYEKAIKAVNDLRNKFGGVVS